MDAWSEVLLRLTEVCLALRPLATSLADLAFCCGEEGEGMRTAVPRLRCWLQTVAGRMPQCGYLCYQS